MNKQKLEQLIHEYKSEHLADFLYEAGFEKGKRQLDEVLPHDDIFCECLQLGELRTSDNQKVLVAETKVTNDLSERSSRKKQFDIGKKLLQNSPAYAAGLFVFYDTHGNFRLSLVHPKFESTRRTYNSFKRYTFYVSPSHSNKTFINQLTSASFNTLDSIKQAFSVAKVTSDFFKEYKRLFEQIVEHIKRDEHFPKFAEESGITVNDVAKKLLGQIVFLYFLQRKGWLGAPKGEHVSKGNQNFLRNLFSKAKAEEAASPDTQMNFFNDYLEYLFYDALNKPITDSATSCYRRRFDCQIPFLNGGLFEPIPEYKWKERFLQIPDDIFSNKDNSGVLDIFDSYNFTIDENSTDDQEVSVDPEMLGKVFENLLEENLRKGTGSYYTPREIVQYMVTESLKQYLIEKTHITSEKVAIALEEYHNDCEVTPEEAKAIDKALKEIKVVDPACGSGAFLVALLQEIAHIRRYCQQCYETTPQTYYQIKKEIIRDSVYGVDLDPGAVDIARLRFWLSMVVDHETGIDDIEPLPNLDYKLMQGNSLLEDMYVGDIKIKLNLDSGKRVDRRTKQGKLIDDGEIEVETQTLGFSEETGERIADKLVRYHHEYFAEKDPRKKAQLKKLIDGLENELIVAGHDDALANLQSQLKNTQKDSDKKKLKERIEEVEESKNDWLKFKVRPYFPWRLHFNEVFEDGGFDIVIGNPPYVRQEEIKNKGVIKTVFQDIYSGRADLYTYFIKKGFEITKKNGLLSYITSNKFFVRGYGIHIRRFLSKDVTLLSLINFGELPVFKASVDSVILIGKNKPVSGKISYSYAKKEEHVADVKEFVKQNNISISQNSLTEEVWVLNEPSHMKLYNKLKENRSTIKDVFPIFGGIKTGLDKAFIIDECKKQEIIKIDKNSSILIKPWFKGRDIKKWVAKTSNYIIYIPQNQIDIDDYPAVKNHLSKYKKDLEKRATNQKWYELQQPQQKFTELFENEKIIYSEIAKEMRAVRDKSHSYGTMKMFFIPFDAVVLLILNSKLFDWYARMCFSSLGDPWKGGRLEFKSMYMEKFPLPDNGDYAYAEELVKKIELQPENKEFQLEINEFIFRMYNITEDEKALIYAS